jgi:hypothetical protein
MILSRLPAIRWPGFTRLLHHAGSLGTCANQLRGTDTNADTPCRENRVGNPRGSPLPLSNIELRTVHRKVPGMQVEESLFTHATRPTF